MMSSPTPFHTTPKVYLQGENNQCLRLFLELSHPVFLFLLMHAFCPQIFSISRHTSRTDIGYRSCSGVLVCTAPQFPMKKFPGFSEAVPQIWQMSGAGFPIWAIILLWIAWETSKPVHQFEYWWL